MALNDICFSVYESILFRAAFTLAYFGLFRVGELVFTTQSYSDRPLRDDDIQFEDEACALRITIRFSKTNQRGNPTTLRIPKCAKNDICCVRALHQFVQIRPDSGQNGYFFCHVNNTPLTRSQFCGVLSRAIRYLGLPGTNYKSHSSE